LSLSHTKNRLSIILKLVLDCDEIWRWFSMVDVVGVVVVKLLGLLSWWFFIVISAGSSHFRILQGTKWDVVRHKQLSEEKLAKRRRSQIAPFFTMNIESGSNINCYLLPILNRFLMF
jgi:hypothetical protein